MRPKRHLIYVRSQDYGEDEPGELQKAEIEVILDISSCSATATWAQPSALSQQVSSDAASVLKPSSEPSRTAIAQEIESAAWRKLPSAIV